MGFFGDITKTVFQFDAIFSNRTEMDAAAAAGIDNIFSGHFVLVKYDPDGSFFEGNIGLGYYDNGTMYADSAHTQPFIYTTFVGPVDSPTVENWASYWYKQGNYYNKLPSQDYFNAEETNYYTAVTSGDNLTYQGQIIRARNISGQPTQNYYYCSSGTNNSIATFTAVIDGENYTPYFTNYNIDKRQYNTDFDIRGYDATIWQKVYSEGHGKFILVAYLNGLVPAIELYADAPTTDPANAYIDNLSSDTVYRIHVPTHWGLKIKEAEMVDNSYPTSDQQMVTEQGVSVPLDIYMNLGGSDFISRQQDYHINTSHKDTSANEIVLTPTGKSGKTYYDKNGNIVEEDMLELGIHLPAIGNAIDTVYDLIYGVGTDDIRPRDINYYNATNSAEQRNIGNTLLGGKTYDLTTIAGNINQLHKLIGQIIYPLDHWPTSEEVATYSSDNLYEYNGRYYRKGIQIIPVDLEESDFSYDQQQMIPESEQSNETFPTNKYYKMVDSSYVPARSFDSSLVNGGYYLKNINGTRYTAIALTQFVQSHFYTKDGENYICDNAESYPTYSNRTYYTNIQTTLEHFTGQYVNDGSFYTYDDGIFTPSYSTSPSLENTYYTLTATDIRSQNSDPVYFYQPDTYYYRDTNTNRFYLITDSIEDFDIRNYSNYWILKFDNEPKYGLDGQGNIIQYYEMIDSQEISTLYNLPSEDHLNPLTNELEPYYLHLYIINDQGEYIDYSHIINLGTINGYSPYAVPRNFYELSITAYTGGDLFLQGAFWYINAQGDYIKDSTKNLNDSSNWYTITAVDRVINPFYLPDTYWYETSPGSNEYDISRTSAMTADTTYYTKVQLFVDTDEFNQCPHGFKWNDYASYIPPSITLYTQSTQTALIQLPELGEKTNSIYGLLLQLQQLYAANDEETRDINTFKGAFNVLQDMLYQIKKLKPEHLLYVNDFGQIDSLSSGNDTTVLLTTNGKISSVTLAELKTMLDNISNTP